MKTGEIFLPSKFYLSLVKALASISIKRITEKKKKKLSIGEFIIKIITVKICYLEKHEDKFAVDISGLFCKNTYIYFFLLLILKLQFCSVKFMWVFK